MINSDQIDYKMLNVDPDILVKAWDGDATAQIILGKACFNAVHTENNCINAFKWFSCAAEQDNMEAQFILANMYALGQGTKQSHVEAHKWYTKAALQGYKKALIRIHNLYQQDRKLHCRGKLHSEEELRIKNYRPYFAQYHHRELNEQRLEDCKLVSSNTISYYTNQFQLYNSCNRDDSENQLNLAFHYQHGFGVNKNIKVAIDYYKKAAESDQRDAQYHLADLYHQNKNIKFNYKLAIRWYRASAISGNVAAQSRLAYCYEKGLSTELNYEGAVFWYTKSAIAGSSDAQLNLGRLYRKEQGVKQSFFEASKWYKLAALQGNDAAQNCLNQIFQMRRVHDISNTEAITEWDNDSSSKTTLRSKLRDDVNKLQCFSGIKSLKILAQHALMTDGSAMYSIGLKYYKGEDFSQDKNAGFQWIKKAAKAGIQEAELKVAKMYKDGDTVKQDYHESSIWTTKLTKKKNNKAQYNLGILYKNGLGVRKDLLEASKWFILSADQGDRDGLYEFGILKFNGEGVRKDREEAFNYFYRSALLGQPDAFFRLGRMYEDGDHVENNKQQAVLMYESAVKLGCKFAQFRLGRIYEEGNLVQKNLVKSLKYYTMAANTGDPFYENELGIKYLNGVFNDPGYIRAFYLLYQAKKTKKIIKNSTFEETNIHFTKIDDISKIIEMLVFATERGVEDIAFATGSTYRDGLCYKRVEFHLPNNKFNLMTHYQFGNVESDSEMLYDNAVKTQEWYNNGNNEFVYDVVDYSSKTSSIENIPANYQKSIEYYIIAATAGNSWAQHQLGAAHEVGKGVDKDPKIAISYYSKAHENGNSAAAYSLALMYLSGNGISQDLIKSFHFFSEASYMGHKDASKMLIPSLISDNLEMLEAVAALGYVAIQYQLGMFYENKNDLKSFQWFTLAAKGGITDAYYKLGTLYEEGRGTTIDYLKAIDLYEKASRNDHKDALYRLAQLYHQGKSIECNYPKAYDFYTKAAEIGHEDATRFLDITRISASSTYKKNQEEINTSLSLLKSVAEHGNVDVQYSLGIFFDNNGENQDYKKAFMWYKIAADKNHVEAIYRLGLLYENGLGVKQDYNKSFELYSQAQAQGNPKVFYRLGLAFHHGYGTDTSIKDALLCYLKAAEFGDHESQYALGVLHEEGFLVQKDVIRALAWYTKAYQNGHYITINKLFDMYEDQSYEQFYYRKLFQILSKFETAYKSDSREYDGAYGLMYFKLGYMYFYGLETAKNYSEALKCFVKAYYDYYYQAAKEFIPLKYDAYKSRIQNDFMEMLQAYSTIEDKIDGNQLFTLGKLYYDGAEIYPIDPNTSEIGASVAVVPKNTSLAFQYTRLASEKGYSEAYGCLGRMYLNGDGVNQDYDEAIKWFDMHAETIYDHNCYDLGMAYLEDTNTQQKMSISLIYLKKAAEKNNFTKQAQLIRMSLQGNCVGEKRKAKIKEIQESVKSMKSDYCYDLGMEFYNGSESEKDYEISLIYMEQAAKENLGEALAQLGVMYLQGDGVEKKYDTAISYIEQSIERMNPEDCFWQGMKFHKGTKVNKNYQVSLMYLRKAADDYDGEAQAQLGKMYLQGNGVEKNYNKAMIYIEKSIMELNANQCYHQGMEYYKGIEVEKNYQISLLYLRKAAQLDYMKAQAQLSLMYLQGNGVEKNRDIALAWMKEFLKKMQRRDCYHLGVMFYTGAEVDKDYEISLIYLRKAAEKNYGLAQSQLGIMYLQGNGIEKSYEKGIEWIRKSVNHMEPNDFYHQGMKFYRGIEVNRNYEISLLYLKNGAKRGDPHSQAQLANMYFKGIAVEEDHERATRWRDRIKSGYPRHSPFSLGQIYHYDENGLQEFSKALKYYRKSLVSSDKLECIGSKNFNKEGTIRGIGLLYEHGDGVDQDYQKAMEYYKKSADLENAVASYNIGLLYYYGRGTDKDHTNALRWFKNLVERELDPRSAHIFIRDDNERSVFDECIDHKYSLQPESIIHGVGHYYLGLIYKNGHGTDRNKDESQEHFKIAREYGIKLTDDFILPHSPFSVNVLIEFLTKVYNFVLLYFWMF